MLAADPLGLVGCHFIDWVGSGAPVRRGPTDLHLTKVGELFCVVHVLVETTCVT